MGFLFRLLLLPLRLLLLPFKAFRAFTTFFTCVVPIAIVIAIGAAVVWFLFLR